MNENNHMVWIQFKEYEMEFEMITWCLIESQLNNHCINVSVEFSDSNICKSCSPVVLIQEKSPAGCKSSAKPASVA